MPDINYDELVIAKELWILSKLRLKKLFGRRRKRDGKILIIDTAIVGDFFATLPALTLFLKKNNLKADIIVSPNLKTIAEKIRGIEKVFTLKSLYSRKIEQNFKKDEIPDEYRKIIFIRTGNEGSEIIKKLHYENLQLYDIPFYKFFLHIVKSMILNKPVGQWRDVNFKILGLEKPRKERIFDDIFKFKKSDYACVKKISELKGNEKKIIIHTGAGWDKKLWNDNRWVELLKKINFFMKGKVKFIFIGGNEEEKKSFDYIRKNLDFKIYSLVGKTDLKDMMLAMRDSDYFIGIDSGPRNIAHIADLRSITLLGPVLKDFMPLDKRDITIDKSNPRTFTLFEKKNENSMEKITANEVFENFKKLIKS